MSFKLHAILSRVTKSCAIHPSPSSQRYQSFLDAVFPVSQVPSWLADKLWLHSAYIL